MPTSTFAWPTQRLSALSTRSKSSATCAIERSPARQRLTALALNSGLNDLRFFLFVMDHFPAHYRAFSVSTKLGELQGPSNGFKLSKFCTVARWTTCPSRTSQKQIFFPPTSIATLLIGWLLPWSRLFAPSSAWDEGSSLPSRGQPLQIAVGQRPSSCKLAPSYQPPAARLIPSLGPRHE